MEVKAKIRPQNLSQDTKALIASDPQVNAFVIGLKNKNAEQIRKKEVLPNSTRVDFRQDLDVLLGEVVRKLG